MSENIATKYFIWVCKNIGLKIIPDLNENRQLLSNEEFVGNAWISCKEHKSEKIDMTEW